jgi:hypothetical protein
MPFYDDKSAYYDPKVWSKIDIILNNLMNVPLDTPFPKLTLDQMLQRTQVMINYIDQLPKQGYLEAIQKDFLLIMDSIN